MSSSNSISLHLQARPDLARLVRMTAANVAMLSSMTVDRVEDLRMAAEEAFIFACATNPEGDISISFDVDSEHVGLLFDLGDVPFAEPTEDDPTAAYADLILASVCDSYERLEGPARLALDIKADV